MVETTRLPGVYFSAEVPAGRQTLPRMDIAAFVGIAASGPLQAPVVVEDADRFHELFGRDAVFPSGQAAQLAPAVRAFFRNGGKRCWVVRVAGSGAVANRFSIPGLRIAASGGQAEATARSEGTWSDGLGVSATLERAGIAVVSIAVGEGVRIKANMGGGVRAQKGDLLELSGRGVTAYARIHGVRDSVLDVSEMHWFNEGSPPDTAPDDWTTRAWQACIVTFSLRVRAADRTIWHLPGLGFAPEHPRYWGWLPSDAQLFPRTEERVTTQPAQRLREEARHPRFPLAGPGDVGLCLPLGMSSQLAEEGWSGPVENTVAALERDGLSVCDASLFLDAALRDYGVATLLDAAFQTQYQDRVPRALDGIHALLRVEEPSILSVPDAVQASWLSVIARSVELLAAPVLSRPSDDSISWSDVEPAEDYTLQGSESVDFDVAETIYSGPLVSAALGGAEGCPKPNYYRVRASRGGLHSPWSNTESAVLPAREFTECGTMRLGAAVLWDPEPALNGRIRLAWTEAEGAPDSYQLETSLVPEFSGAKTLKVTTAREFVFQKPAQLTYYRVRPVRAGVAGPASNTVLSAGPPPDPVVIPEDQLVAGARAETIHTAMLRMCAARGDMFAVLTLPQSYQEADTLQHRAALMEALAGEDPERTLSFGAIYHPWTTVSETTAGAGAVRRTVSPDGAICGTYAARTLAGAAWYAPANMILSGVVSVDPRLDTSALSLYRSQINQIRQFPRGFAVHAAETLSTSREFRSVNVRRLFILLRRLALREGMRYVFQPNDGAFQRLVHRQWEIVLGDLFLRGAFTGATADEAFRVTTNDTVNTRESLDLGRFIVELRVAPSEPLHFLTVRLVQTATDVSLSEETL